ncbi:DsbE family thiol:disulfide interchange protein [Chelativorans composti]|uniref:DsbE family thiol:disulfide interchange protein n=1 Tax=Chelativorans composti TaxID=768533 RepID=A0ABW5DFI9_9HYPH
MNRRGLLLLLPLAIFLVLCAVFLVQLMSGRDISVVPSALIGKPAPLVTLEPLEGTNLPGFDPEMYKGRVTLVNVWGSWCVPCRQEHPQLMELARDSRIQLAGINYKDKPENALRFLNELGNPFDVIGVDESGRAVIDWGVYGVPETFVVGPDGVIRYKHVGPLTQKSILEQILPEIDKALVSSTS